MQNLPSHLNEELKKLGPQSVGVAFRVAGYMKSLGLDMNDIAQRMVAEWGYSVALSEWICENAVAKAPQPSGPSLQTSIRRCAVSLTLLTLVAILTILLDRNPNIRSLSTVFFPLLSVLGLITGLMFVASVYVLWRRLFPKNRP